ncbi:hypothetical protein QYE76_011351 [Lolium multiflorum]|uniref:Reverse transcriptase Ty1/copia-type domain-containing protein n=1 Tax=Lolium multiflorum TaxID=4521 RepID=A0AAD8X5J3_LOLMU|nr:hypothetical protein QYE76_011351 [Lolium multiflorum]
MDYSRLCRGGGDGHLEALTGDNIDLIAAHLDVTYTVRLAACSRELYDMISKDEGKMHHWDEPCLLMPPPAYWFDEHWDVATASRLHDTVYDLVPLDHPRRSVALPFMHDRKWLGANGDWIAAADHHGWCLVNVYTERHIPLPSLPDSKIRHSIVSYRPAYSFNWGPAIYLLKIVICQVPTKGGRYADYKLIALFDKTIFYLEGGGDWRMLEALTPAPDYPNYCDAIELRGHVFAVDETDGSTYFWDTANENPMLPFVIPPPVVDDQQSEGKIFVAKNGTFLEKEFLTKEVTGRKVELDEVTEPSLVDQSSAVPEDVPVPPAPVTEEANDNDHETSSEVATEPRRSTRERTTPDWYDPCLNLMIVDNNDEDPATYEEAMMSPDSNKWQEAMKSKMGSMYDNKVWTLVDLPDSRKAVENKWIFKRKTDADGNVTVYKARLVAKGFRQIQGVDYDETLSPVAKLKSVRILLAIAAFFDYEIWQMDVKTAFLNGDIEEELYMVQPKGFVNPKNADMPPPPIPSWGIEEIASGTLPERGIITGGLYITMPASGLMRE